MESGKRSLEAAWKKALEQIADEVPEQEFATWFRGVEYAGGTDTQLQLSVPSSFTRTSSPSATSPRIEEKLAEIAVHDVTVKFSVQRRKGKEAADEAPAAVRKAEEAPAGPAPASPAQQGIHLRAIHHRGVQLLRRQRVPGHLEEPGHRLQPLPHLRGVGLGKTHLVQAIGNAVAREFPDLKVAYVTVEAFANEFIQSIQKKAGHQFKNRYRGRGRTADRRRPLPRGQGRDPGGAVPHLQRPLRREQADGVHQRPTGLGDPQPVRPPAQPVRARPERRPASRPTTRRARPS